MGVVPARAAGVGAMVVASPADREGDVHPVLLGAAGLLGVDALARRRRRPGDRSARLRPRRRGPRARRPRRRAGSAWVTAAKIEVVGDVGIDLPAGPSGGPRPRRRLGPCPLGGRRPPDPGRARRGLPGPAGDAGRGLRRRGRGAGPPPACKRPAPGHPGPRHRRPRPHRPGPGHRCRHRVRQRLRARAPVRRGPRSRGRGRTHPQRRFDLRGALVAGVGRRLCLGREPRAADGRPRPCLRAARGGDLRQVQPGAADHARRARGAPPVHRHPRRGGGPPGPP